MAKTVVAANGFSRSKQTPEKTEGQSQFNMRQAMSLDPRIGKILSKVSIRHQGTQAWQLSQAETSNYIDPTEIDVAVAGIARDGFYVFDHRASAQQVGALVRFAEETQCETRGAGTPLEV